MCDKKAIALKNLLWALQPKSVQMFVLSSSAFSTNLILSIVASC